MSGEEKTQMRLARYFVLLAVVAGLAAACGNPERRDAAVNEAVLAKLSSEPQLANDSVQAETKNGHVYLTGQVLNQAHRQVAEDRAQEVKGVKSVTNSIEIAVSSPPPSAVPPAAAPPEQLAPPSEPTPDSGEPESEPEND
jgi:hypothetical protein